MKMLIATHNQNKVKELNQLLKASGVICVGLDLYDDHDEVDETEQTFIGNATLKAKYFATKYQMPSLSDDSGIEVEALNQRPGIYSKRYSGEGNHQNNLKLLDELKDKKNRNARFVAAIVVAFPDGKTFEFEGYVYGKIALELTGDKGFGYDPLFIPDGYNESFAALGPDIKQQISHRANAIKALKERLDEIAHYK